jgi:hypothetical protein
VAALLFVAELSRNDPDLPGGGAPAEQDRPGLRQLTYGAGDQDRLGTGVRQPERDGSADTAPRARDQRGLTSKIIHHYGLPRTRSPSLYAPCHCAH